MNTVFLASLGIFQLFLLLFILGGLLLLPILALISIVKNDFTGNNKLIWVLLVVFLPFLGSILYFALGKGQKINSEPPI